MNVSRTRLTGVALLIFAATVWLYWPSVHGEFLNGDDREYFRQAERLHGLTWNGVKWAFATMAPYYQPLPRLSHVLDYQFWGKNAVGHHATSVFVHALNAALVFGFVWALLAATSVTIGQRLTLALCVAMAFAVHPLQAESVAWISGRTQLLCMTFGIGCLWAYVVGVRRWILWTLFVAALLSKPMAMSLPFVMLAIDYFPLRRYEQLGWGRLLREKAMLIGLGAATAAAAMITESQKGGLMIPLEKISLSQRVLLMFQSLVYYPWKLVWPEHLSPYCPLRLGLSLDQWPVLVSVLSVGMITGLVVWFWRRLPALIAGWAAYLTLILPVSGLVPAGLQSVALRHAYMAILPLLLMVGGAGVWVWRGSRTVAHVTLIGCIGCGLCFFGLRTRSLIPIWHNDETWWRTPLVEFPNSELANRMLTGALLAEGKTSEALEYAQRDIQIAPEQCLSHLTLGFVLSQLGRLEDAIEQYEQAVRIEPDLAEARNSLGRALAERGRTREAIEQYQQALRINPDYAEACNNLGLALAEAGRIPEAMDYWNQALRLLPDFAEAHYNWGVALAQLGRVTEAMEHWKQAIRTKPDFTDAHYNLGLAFEKMDRSTEAIEHYEQALKLRPDFSAASNALARLRAAQTGQ